MTTSTTDNDTTKKSGTDGTTKNISSPAQGDTKQDPAKKGNSSGSSTGNK